MRAAAKGISRGGEPLRYLPIVYAVARSGNRDPFSQQSDGKEGDRDRLDGRNDPQVCGLCPATVAAPFGPQLDTPDGSDEDGEDVAAYAIVKQARPAKARLRESNSQNVHGWSCA